MQSEFHLLLLWIELAATVAMIIGFIHGLHGVLDIFNLVWKTGKSHDKEIIETADLFRKLMRIAVLGPIATAIVVVVLR